MQLPRPITSEQGGPATGEQSVLRPEGEETHNHVQGTNFKNCQVYMSGQCVMQGNVRAGSSLSYLPGRGWGGGEKDGERGQ